MVPNPDQYDADLDGYGNLCDADLNNDGGVGVDDVGLVSAALGSADPVAEFGDDGAVGLDDMGVVLGALGELPGPSGLACAGTVPCP